MSLRCHVFCLLYLGLMIPSVQSMAEENWPPLRWAAGDFHAADDEMLTKWSADNVLWRSELEGLGQSSPTVWGDHIFLTAAEKTAGGEAARNLLCLSRADGKLIWKKTCSTGPGRESAQDEHLGHFDLCYRRGARRRLLRSWWFALLHHHRRASLVAGAGGNVGPWGFAASPVILDQRVILNGDSFGESFIAAYNIADGKEVWRTKRKDKPRGGWSTPILIDTGKRKELVVNGEFGVAAYDPETGEDLWFCKSFNGRGTPMPAFTSGVLVTVNGKPGDLYAITPGGSGDVTESHMAWHTRRGGGRDLPSPVAVGDQVFVVSMAGIGSLYDAKTGKQIWQDRIGGNYSATPFVAGGLIYLTSEAGETVVIRPGEKLDIVSRNRLGDVGDEIFRASSTPHRGQILLRSQSALYCVAP